MKQCEYCGVMLQDTDGFCSNCGAPAPAASPSASTYVNTASTAGSTIVEGTGDYSLVLVSLGNCTKAAASDLIERILGYDDDEVEDLFNMLPAQAAQQLNYDQANYLAQAMSEYGMEVSVRNGSGYLSSDSDEEEETSIIFDGSGSFLSKAAAVLGMLTGANKMRKFRKLEEKRYYDQTYRKPQYAPKPFRPEEKRSFRSVDQKPAFRPMHEVPQKPQNRPAEPKREAGFGHRNESGHGRTVRDTRGVSSRNDHGAPHRDDHHGSFGRDDHHGGMPRR